jgi:predicted RNA-binding protein with PIN domain
MSLAYVIDGYNLIKHSVLADAIRKGVSGRQGTGSEQAALVQIIRASRLTGSENNRVVIVFDGYSPTQVSLAGGQFEIVYSCDISADDYILRLVEKAQNPRNVVVVSDDRQVQASSKLRGACVIGVEEFCGKGAAAKKAARQCEQEDMRKLSHSDMERVNKELREKWLK